MHRRHPLPCLWLMTDERQGERLWPALENLPRGSGVVVRHYGLTPKKRRALIVRIRAIARTRRLVMIIAGPPGLARASRADGFHSRAPHRTPSGLIRTAAVHGETELRLAERIGADLVFISPVFATDSHPGGRPLGRLRFGRLATRSRIPVIALGGMNRRQARSLRSYGIYGWAGIGSLTPKKG